MNSGRYDGVDIPFKEIWCVDFEFRADDGERPWPVCMVAFELESRRELRLWRNDLQTLQQAPFATGPEALFVAFYNSAEMGCFLELGWPLPDNILDLFVEHRVDTNGMSNIPGNSLLHALAYRGLAHIDAVEKESMRDMVCSQTEWSESEKLKILDYCASDVRGLAALFPVMATSIDWPRALVRGRYMAAVARMERTGVPIDTKIYHAIVDNWENLKIHLIADVNAVFGVYEGTTFKSNRFAQYLSAQGIPWPRHLTGALRLDDETFHDQVKRWPVLRPLYELRTTLSGLRLTGLTVGSDGRNRCLLSPFRAITSRNQPSTTKFIFGPAKWMRGLLKPPEGFGLAYIDFSSQEIGIAAALSGDELMKKGYQDGDPYLAFAKAAKLVPEDATKQSHKAIRDRCKTVVLGVNYGMGPDALAAMAGITATEAKELLRIHRNTYRKFWRWIDDTVSAAMLTSGLQTVFGWRQQVGKESNPRSLMNFPMQANGAEMMRMAAIAATESGIEVCAPIHDAFLIMAPLHRLDDDVARMQEIMTEAGRLVTGGLDIRTEAEIVRWPERYMDERGRTMWDSVVKFLNGLDRAAA
jgi:DNA polymerase-1